MAKNKDAKLRRALDQKKMYDELMDYAENFESGIEEDYLDMIDFKDGITGEKLN